MVNGIGSYNSYQSYLQTQSTTNGNVSQSELETLEKMISSETGQTNDTSNTNSTYDNDGDSGLNLNELISFMASTMQQGMGFAGIPPASQDSSDSSASTDLFNAITGGSSTMTQAELDTWATDMAQATGNTIDTTNAISTYGTDGTLTASEFQSFLAANGISAPQNVGMAPPPPPESSGMDSSTTSSTSSAESIISKYDTNGDGLLSASELQAYLDDQSSSSTNSLIAQALSAYTSSLGNSDTYNNLQNLFMSLTGSSGSYSPVDLSV